MVGVLNDRAWSEAVDPASRTTAVKIAKHCSRSQPE